MLFYDLPRFSVDLDFNLLNPSRSTEVFNKTRDIVAGYGIIKDEAIKHFGMIIVLDYGLGERNLKIEVSGRLANDNYEVKNYLGIPMQVMQLPDMFSHKLCALTDRKMIANRDIFDCWFLMQRRTPLNKIIVETRTKTDLHTYIQQCIDRMEQVNEKRILSGLGELIDEETKRIARNSLKAETISLLKIYRQFPVLTQG